MRRRIHYIVCVYTHDRHDRFPLYWREKNRVPNICCVSWQCYVKERETLLFSIIIQYTLLLSPKKFYESRAYVYIYLLVKMLGKICAKVCGCLCVISAVPSRKSDWPRVETDRVCITPWKSSIKKRSRVRRTPWRTRSKCWGGEFTHRWVFWLYIYILDVSLSANSFSISITTYVLFDWLEFIITKNRLRFLYRACCTSEMHLFTILWRVYNRVWSSCFYCHIIYSL